MSESTSGYLSVLRHRMFLRFAPRGFFHYGGMIAAQSLWAGLWLAQVFGWSAEESARGLFAINLSMLVSFLLWGSLVPRLYKSGWTAHSLMALGTPISVAVLVVAVALGARATAAVWAVFCVSCTVGSLSQPAIGRAFPAALAGRALSAYNLVVFAGVFCLQWGIGLAVDGLQSAGWPLQASYQGALALLAIGCTLSYV